MPTIVTHYTKPLPTGPLPKGQVIIGYDTDAAHVYVFQWDEEEHRKTGQNMWKGVCLDDTKTARVAVAGDPLTFLESWVLVEPKGRGDADQ